MGRIGNDSSDFVDKAKTTKDAILLEQEAVWDTIKRDERLESVAPCKVEIPSPTVVTLPQVTKNSDNTDSLRSSNAPIDVGLSDKDSDQDKLKVSVTSFDKAEQALISKAKAQKEAAEAAAKKESEAQKQSFKKSMEETPQYRSWFRKTIRALRGKAKEEVEKEQAEKAKRKPLRSAL